MSTNLITIAICSIGISGCVAFMSFWIYKAGWDIWAREVGWYIATGVIDLFLIMALLLSVRLFGDWPGRRLAVIGLSLFWTLQPWWLLRMTWYAYRNPTPANLKERQTRHDIRERASDDRRTG